MISREFNINLDIIKINKYIKPIERVDPEDLELLYAFHSAPTSIQDAVLKLLDLGRG